MTQTVVFGFGGINRLPSLLHRIGGRRPFLVTGQASFECSGASAALRGLLDNGVVVGQFRDFSENPKLEDVMNGIAAFRAAVPDAVVAIGGGSALDMGKLVNILAHQEREPLDIIQGREPITRSGVPLIAVPTTAGSGSEATHFAVVYVGHAKYSVAAPALMPSAAVVDPGLTCSLSPRLTAVSGMDAFAQAVESYWSVNSTEDSQACARHAISLLLRFLPEAVHAPTRRARRAVCKASHLAGRAINITKTTGAHALSYPLTSYLGIPHGLAVSLTLGRWLLFNSQVQDDDVTDPRGADYVRRVVAELVGMLGSERAEEGCDRIEGLLRSVGLPTRLSSLGVSRGVALEIVVPNVNVERLGNNPRASTPASLRTLIEAVC